MMQPVIMQPYHMNFDYNNHLKNWYLNQRSVPLIFI
jgi:hypothetical protein